MLAVSVHAIWEQRVLLFQRHLQQCNGFSLRLKRSTRVLQTLSDQAQRPYAVCNEFRNGSAREQRALCKHVLDACLLS